MKTKKKNPKVRSFVFAIFALLFAASPCLRAQNANANSSQTEKYRLVWFEDPTTTATFAWNQKKGDPATVYYGRKNHDREKAKYPKQAKVNRVINYDGMKNCFARLENMRPDTWYFMCLGDDFGVSRRFYFKTAPAKAKKFTFIGGGDSRNFREVRRSANAMCAKLKPLFVAFTGDMINHDNAAEWNDWLDDWQLTINANGRLIPIAPHRGNHEVRKETISKVFGMPEGAYAAFTIGGDLFRYYILNSEIPADGAQGKWLADDVKKNAAGITHLVAGYHKPMRPHTSGKPAGRNSYKWADLFYAAGFDLVLESDSHVMKRTAPLRPDANGDSGFSAAPEDPHATVYVGEGCWGAPLRRADVNKEWTLGNEAFNGFDWFEVTPEAMRDKTVKISNPASVGTVNLKDPFNTPQGLQLWNPGGHGEVLTIPAD